MRTLAAAATEPRHARLKQAATRLLLARVLLMTWWTLCMRASMSG